jgi:hypothetical protein
LFRFEVLVMRRSLAGSFVPATFALLFALAPTGSVVAEDAEFQDVQSEGSQIVAAGVPDAAPGTKNLNSVPIDGLGARSAKGPDGSLVRRLLAARPGEDLVICVAGCFSGRDRVVYAQPSDVSLKLRKSVELPAKSSASAAANFNSSPNDAATSQDPKAPTILNGASDGTAGSK